MKRIKFEHCVFIQAKKKGVFDKKDPNKKFPFSFIKFEQPKENYLINKGVTDVIQSWDKERNKILFTGLIPFYDGYYFFGDNFNEKGKKDFVLLYFNEQNNEYHFFLAKNRNPRKKLDFAFQLMEYLYFNGYLN